MVGISVAICLIIQSLYLFSISSSIRFCEQSKAIHIPIDIYEHWLLLLGPYFHMA